MATSPWSPAHLQLQRQIALELWYASEGKITGADLAAALMADLCTDGRSISAKTARLRVREAITELGAHGDLARLRDEFLAELAVTRAQVMSRITGAPSAASDLRSLVGALLELQARTGDHFGLHRVAPPEVAADVELTDEEVIAGFMASVDPATLATLCPGAVRAAADRLDQIMSP